MKQSVWASVVAMLPLRLIALSRVLLGAPTPPAGSDQRSGLCLGADASDWPRVLDDLSTLLVFFLRSA